MRTRTVNFGILLQEQQGETKYKHMCLIFISNSSNTDNRKKAKISCSQEHTKVELSDRISSRKRTILRNS